MDPQQWGTGLLIASFLGMAGLWARLSGKPHPVLAQVCLSISFGCLAGIAAIWTVHWTPLGVTRHLLLGVLALILTLAVIGIWRRAPSGRVAVVFKTSAHFRSKIYRKGDEAEFSRAEAERAVKLALAHFKLAKDRRRAERSGFQTRLSDRERRQIEHVQQHAGYLCEKLRSGYRVGAHEIRDVRSRLVSLDQAAGLLSYFPGVSGSIRDFMQALFVFMPDQQTGNEDVDPLIGHRPRFDSVEDRKQADKDAIDARDRLFATCNDLLAGE